MNINLITSIDPEVVNHLKRRLIAFETHSAIFKQRLEDNWKVNISKGEVIDAYQKKGEIYITMPVHTPWDRHPKMIDIIAEAAEAILFECGNAQRQSRYDEIDNLAKQDPAGLSLMEYGERMANVEAENGWWYLCGLEQAVTGVALSEQGKRDIAAKLDNLPAFQRKFREAPHVPGDRGSQGLESKYCYAYEKISKANSFRTISVFLKNFVVKGASANTYQKFMYELNNVLFEKHELVAVYRNVLRIVEEVGPDGGWIKRAGYAFTPQMQQLAHPHRLSVGNKTKMWNLMKDIANGPWGGRNVPVPYWLR